MNRNETEASLPIDTMHIFDLIHDLQLLRAKSAMVPLDDAESARLAALTRRVCADGDEEESTLIRMLRPMPVQLVVSGRGFVAARLRVLSGEGFTIQCDQHELQPGESILVRIELEQVSYTFPCVVVSPSALDDPFRGSAQPRRGLVAN